MSDVNIEIDGKKLKVAQGTMVIEAADHARIPIPRFCYHKKLSIAANCRMCLVQVENARKPLPACATPVSEGMKIFTKSAMAKDAQKTVMEFLLVNHPLDCPICDQGGQCELQDIALEYGKDYSKYSEGKRSIDDENIGPLIATDMTRCIYCTRCVRFGDEVAGLKELGVAGRGEHSQVGLFLEQSVNSELSGNVIDLCPVGSLTSKVSRYHARAWETQARAQISVQDSLQANLYHHICKSKVIQTVPRENDSVNETWLTDADRFSYEAFHSPERITEPQIKVDGQWQTVDWETALQTATQAITQVVSGPGGQQVGALASSFCTNEEYYLLSQLMEKLGSANLDHQLRKADGSERFVSQAVPIMEQSLAEFENNDVIMVVGGHPRRQVPLLNQRIFKATKAGAKVVHLQAFPDTHRYPVEVDALVNKGDFVGVLAQVLKAIVQIKQVSLPSSIDALLSGVTPNEVASSIAKTILEGQKGTLLLGADALSHPQSHTIQWLARVITQVTGMAFTKLHHGSNPAGAWVAGVLPDRGVIGQPQPQTIGQSALEMLQNPLKAMILLNLDADADFINPRLAVESLSRVEHVIHIGSYANHHTREYATVMLPMVTPSENEGSMINLVGHWQSFKPCLEPEGQSKPAWKVFRVLGNLLGLEGFQYNHVKEVSDELKAFYDAYKPGSDELSLDKLVDLRPHSLESNQSNQLIRLAPMGMYRTNPVIRRAPSLQKTIEGQATQFAVLHSQTASQCHVQAGDKVRIVQDSRPGKMSFDVKLDDSMCPGTVLVQAGTEQSSDLGAPFSSVEVQKINGQDHV